MTFSPSPRQWSKRFPNEALPAAAYSAEVATSATKAERCGVSCEILRSIGQSLWAAWRSRYSSSPKLRRVLLALPTPPKQPLRLRRPGIPTASYGVFGEGESSYPAGRSIRMLPIVIALSRRICGRMQGQATTPAVDDPLASLACPAVQRLARPDH